MDTQLQRRRCRALVQNCFFTTIYYFRLNFTQKVLHSGLKFFFKKSKESSLKKHSVTGLMPTDSFFRAQKVLHVFRRVQIHTLSSRCIQQGKVHIVLQPNIAASKLLPFQWSKAVIPKPVCKALPGGTQEPCWKVQLQLAQVVIFLKINKISFYFTDNSYYIPVKLLDTPTHSCFSVF